MYKNLAIVIGVCATISLFLSIFEPSSNDMYHSGMLQAILSMMLWDRGVK